MGTLGWEHFAVMTAEEESTETPFGELTVPWPVSSPSPKARAALDEIIARNPKPKRRRITRPVRRLLIGCPVVMAVITLRYLSEGWWRRRHLGGQ